MKYKTKYIEYKNNLLVVNGKKRGSGSKSTLVGGGLNASIAFFSNNTFFANNSNVKTNIDHHISLFNITSLNPIYIIVTYILNNTAHIITYKIIKKVGSGTSGTVYKLEQIQPSPQSSLNNFVIKLNVLDKDEGKDESKLTEIDKEGQNTDKLQILYRSKALFQGNTCNIDFAIFNYLGQDLGTFLSKNSSTMTAPIILSLIKQLHEQLYSLNNSSNFHNDVKMPNIVVKVDEKTGIDYELSLIDFGLVTHKNSGRGTIESMCLYGCASFLLEKITEEEEEEEEEERKILVHELKNLQLIAVSSDYVGFFNIIICLFNPNYCAYKIYYYILEIDGGYSPEKLLHILCLLCYVSNSADCNTFLAIPKCAEIVRKIDTNLEGTKEHMKLFTSDESPHMVRRLRFLCFIYSIISNYETDNVKFVDISKLPKFLFDISCCLDLQFNLEQFNENFGSIFNEKLLEPAPAPAQPALTQPTPEQPTGQ
jgi:serine/threonine protein kinase